jgi:hypothetical protein
MELGSAIESVKRVLSELRERFSRHSSSERDVRAMRIGVAGLCLLIAYIVFHTFWSGQSVSAQVTARDGLGRIENLRSECETGGKKPELSAR